MINGEMLTALGLSIAINMGIYQLKETFYPYIKKKSEDIMAFKVDLSEACAANSLFPDARDRAREYVLKNSEVDLLLNEAVRISNHWKNMSAIYEVFIRDMIVWSGILAFLGIVCMFRASHNYNMDIRFDVKFVAYAGYFPISVMILAIIVLRVVGSRDERRIETMRRNLKGEKL